MGVSCLYHTSSGLSSDYYLKFKIYLRTYLTVIQVSNWKDKTTTKNVSVCNAKSKYVSDRDYSHC